MNNIIFLDIDGVLNDNCSKLSLQNVWALKQLIEKYDSKVVLISSLQGSGTKYNRKKLSNLFESIGVYNVDFIDPNFEGEFCNIKLPSRLLGIIDYLKKYPVSNYVILDDEYHNDYRLICLNYYRTKTYRGLTDKDLCKISLKPVNLNNFQYINYEYRQLGNYEEATNNLIKVLKKKCGL